MYKHDLKNVGIAPAYLVLKAQKRAFIANIIINALGVISGFVIVLLCTIVLFEGSL